jgi:predicted esterase
LTPVSPYEKASIVRSDLPTEFSHAFEYIHSRDSVDENLMIFFHGMGDSLSKWRNLAETMNLPQTCCLCLRAPIALPLSMGHTWYTALDIERDADDLAISPAPGELRRVQSLQQVRSRLILLLDSLEKKGWSLSKIHLFGFSQGGDVALDLAAAMAAMSRPIGTRHGVSSEPTKVANAEALYPDCRKCCVHQWCRSARV